MQLDMFARKSLVPALVVVTKQVRRGSRSCWSCAQPYPAAARSHAIVVCRESLAMSGVTTLMALGEQRDYQHRVDGYICGACVLNADRLAARLAERAASHVAAGEDDFAGLLNVTAKDVVLLPTAKGSRN